MLTDRSGSIAVHWEEPIGSHSRMSDAAVFSRNPGSEVEYRLGQSQILLSDSVAAIPDKTRACHSLEALLRLGLLERHFSAPIDDKRIHQAGLTQCYN